jgi:ketosteroid isomerase-like protein
MSNHQIVRKPLAVRQGSGRTLSQRFFIRFPRLAVAYARWIGRMPPRSRFRQVVVSRGLQLAIEALNRRDLDAALIAYHPDREMYPPREFVDAGFAESCYRGPAAFRTYMAEWSQVWGRDLRVEPAELIDLGDRWVMLGALPSRGQASGLPLTSEYAAIMTLRGGEVLRQQDYTSHAEALDAARLRD